jgi:hypothetical protein
MHLAVQIGVSNCKALLPHLKTMKAKQIRAGSQSPLVKTARLC